MADQTSLLLEMVMQLRDDYARDQEVARQSRMSLHQPVDEIIARIGKIETTVAIAGEIDAQVRTELDALNRKLLRLSRSWSSGAASRPSAGGLPAWCSPAASASEPWRRLAVAIIVAAALLLVALPIRVHAAECGTASFYAEAHHGRLMANGQPFDMNAMTAASNTLPLGSRARVVAGKRSVVVTITDTGSFGKYGRIIDLSRAAFAKLSPLRQGLWSASRAHSPRRPFDHWARPRCPRDAGALCFLLFSTGNGMRTRLCQICATA